MAEPHGRVELHCHLDGSIPPSTLLRISQQRSLALPGLGGRVPESTNDIWTALRSMGAVWRWFDLVNEIIGGDEATLADIAEEFVHRQAAENISYTEVRWDPVRPSRSSLANASIPVASAVRAVALGLRRGSEARGVEVYQLLCAMRGAPAQACYDLASLVNETRSGELGGVVGMDLAGDEYHFNNSVGEVQACFADAKTRLRLNTTVHAGEMADDEYSDVSSAVLAMHADRVGHGYAAIQNSGVVSMLRQRGVPLEACPAGHHDNLHATDEYRREGLNFGLSTDDPASYFANVTMSDVERLVTSQLGFTAADVASAHRRAYSARFAPDAARIVGLWRSGGSSSRGVADAVTAAVVATLVSAVASVIAAIVGATLVQLVKKRWRRSPRARAKQKASAAAIGLPDEVATTTTQL